MIRVRVVFSGRVQGVGFRATARDCASSPRVSGWVRNEHDGTVMMEIQGEAAEVDAAIARLQARMSRNITHIDRTEISPENHEFGFIIAR